MYRRILVAIDGSALSQPAIRYAIGLAKSLGAALTAVYVVAPYAGAGAAGFAALRGYSEAVRKDARKALAGFSAEARAQCVTARAISVVGGEPWRRILLTARELKCDLIVMASHGRGGFAGLLLGSETTKVLTHSKLPVLVCR
jgi:nucleotide-binding universal stress UspA family protein